MSVLSWLLGEDRAIDASDFNIGDDLFPGKTASGVTVTQDTALNLITVYACIRLISGTVSNLPVDLFRRDGEQRVRVDRRPMWLDFPNPEQTWRQFSRLSLHSILTHGNAFALIAARDDLGFPSELELLHPEDVTVRRTNGRKEFLHGPSGRTFRMFTARRPDGDVLHLMGHSSDGLVGLSPIDLARQTIGRGLAIDEYGARFFGNGTQSSGVLEMPVGSTPTEDQLKTLSSQFRRRHSGVENAWKPIVLANGAQWKPITVPNDQAQFIESEKMTVNNIARLFGVAPHLVGDVERSTSWGSGIEQQGIGFVTYNLGDYIGFLEDGFSQLAPQGEYVKINVNGLLRGDSKSRFEAYAKGITNGFMSRDEVRALEDLPPVDGLDEFFVPVNVAKPQDDKTKQVEAVGALIRAGFQPAAALEALGLDPIAHTDLLPVTVQRPDQGATE